VLVLGGTGFVGRHVCEHLIRAGWRVTVPTRRASRAAAVQHLPGLTVAVADVHDPAALARLMAGHAAVVNLVAILHGNEAAFESTHVELPRRIAQAAQQAGVRQFVHVSALGASPDAVTSAPSCYLRSKSRGEAVLRELQARHQAPALLTVLRPSVIFGADDRFLNLFASLQKVFPVMPLAGAATRFQPVWVDDVARALVQCMELGPRALPLYELCGPEVLTLRDLVRLAGRAAGVRHGRGRPVLPLPRAAGWLQALAMECLPGEPLMSRDNLDSMRMDNVATGAVPGLSALGVQALGPTVVAPGYLGGGDALLGLRARLRRR
jgi:NADH dehydrogenase